MASLQKDLRNELSNAVQKARDLAEQAAYKALHTLGVQEADPPSHLSNEQRLLRRALRAQARQLGDSLNKADGTHSVHHLSEKIAYDHWHRILFARFLAENNLLYSTQHGIAVTLDDCTDLAKEQGLRDGWEFATRLAAQMLPQIFRNDDPAGQIEFAPEDKIALQKLVTDLDPKNFHADDSLGWVYQYWQTKRKKEVNDAEIKIGADELAPVTQLFTEDYMVLFLLHNTLGAWWAGKQLANGLSKQQFETEADLREALALLGINWEYLRFVKENEEWRPAAGIFGGWPKTTRDIRMLDPCMGSGHFLIFALPILVAMRREEEGLLVKEAVKAVLHENLFGLEIDPRCTQIAAFNLAFTAWKIVGYQSLPPIHLACSGIAPQAKLQDWVKLAGDDEKAIRGMERLYKLFEMAPILGSLIDPKQDGDLLTAGFEELKPLLDKALRDEKADENRHEMAVAARGIETATEILSQRFTLVGTNVPFLARGKQCELLKDFCAKQYSESMGDLSTVFIERLKEMSALGCSFAYVSPEQWFYTQTYIEFRQKILRNTQWCITSRLGPAAFQIMNWWAARTILLVASNGFPDETHKIAVVDLPYSKDTDVKPIQIKGTPIGEYIQLNQLRNPDGRVTLGEFEETALLSSFADVHAGIQTGDLPHFVRGFTEFPRKNKGWEFQLRTVNNTNPYAGRTLVLLWEDGKALSDEPQAVIRGTKAIGGRGVCINRTASLAPTLYSGEIFDQNAAVIIPQNLENLPALWCFVSSKEYALSVRELDRNTGVAPATLIKVPFDLVRWKKVATEKYPHGLPKPYSTDPTQWLFGGHPKSSDNPLHVSLARLLGYQWPRQTGSSFPDCPPVGPDGLEKHEDDDGIVCINAIIAERPAAERLRALLADAFGKEWNTEKLNELLTQVGFEGSTIEDWLRNGFFEQHCQLFHQRPFIWQVWDGRRDGFSALVNYHKLDRPTLEKLTYTYLGDWIARQKAANDAGEPGSDDRLRAARELQEKLKLIIEGEAPYDIFVRWKPLEKQPVGWDPDLNDGVRLNIRPFVTAGVLRKNPKINWNKDRGKDVESAPWFKKFGGERINDWHLTLEDKSKGALQK